MIDYADPALRPIPTTGPIPPKDLEIGSHLTSGLYEPFLGERCRNKFGSCRSVLIFNGTNLLSYMVLAIHVLCQTKKNKVSLLKGKSCQSIIFNTANLVK